MMEIKKKRSICKSYLKTTLLMTTGCIFVLLYIYTKQTSSVTRPYRNESEIKHRHGNEHRHESSKTNFKVLWYNIPGFIGRYPETKRCGFKPCMFKNCHITFKRKEALNSHAVIFDGMFMPNRLHFSRPNGQIWIFYAHEAPSVYYKGGNWWFKNRSYVFNWTMTYDKDNTDIHLPYGEILKRTHEVKRDFRAIAQQKNASALLIASHCGTFSKRQQYVRKLQKYVDVEILGDCGKKWNCGHRFSHDDCFDLLNSSYRFFLAFENAFCNQYFTEKMFWNFNYDIIMVTRGGKREDARNTFPAGTYISTDDFRSIQDLGKLLKSISIDDYAKLLQRKSQFYSPGYRVVYQRALCEICERLNHAEKYGKVIKDMHNWAFGPKPCPDENGDSR